GSSPTSATFLSAILTIPHLHRGRWARPHCAPNITEDMPDWPWHTATLHRPFGTHMEIKRGIAVSPGVAVGPSLVLDAEWFHIPRRAVPEEARPAEIRRLHDALAAAAAEARQEQDAVSDRLGARYGAIFAAHALLIEDVALRNEA